MTAQQHRAIEAFRNHGYYRGMEGLGVTQQQAAGVVGSSLITSGSALMKIPGGQIPGAILEVAGALSDIVALFGPNPYNEYATEIVNRVQNDVMTPNLQAWQALADSQKTASAQQAALKNFQDGWNYVVNACTNPQLGSAGINCIADRDRGACKWKDSSGACWNWWTGYHDPIANDPAVHPDPVSSPVSSVTGGIDTAVSSVSSALGGISPLYIGLAVIALAFVVSD